MANLTRLRLIQFKAGYNLPVHVGKEKGIFARHGLEIDFAYTPGSLYLAEALRKGEYEIGHTGADDVVADVEDYGGGPDALFLFMGLHSGLLSLVTAPGLDTAESLRGKTLAVDACASGVVFILEKLLRSKGFTAADYCRASSRGPCLRLRLSKTPWNEAIICWLAATRSFPAIKRPAAPRNARGRRSTPMFWSAISGPISKRRNGAWSPPIALNHWSCWSSTTA